MSESNTTGWKIFFIIICFAITMAAGLAPMKIRRCHSNQKMLGIANSFSGGVFLAIAFVHILPETCNLYYYSKLKKIMEDHHHPVEAENGQYDMLSNDDEHIHAAKFVT
mmetsp:Transcript_28558/g.33533  ORF Transcript_28558/g.33533 Transcript_28558/m.33533 type:complete len:109 (-) Transcript_28558:137-463(-)